MAKSGGSASAGGVSSVLRRNFGFPLKQLTGRSEAELLRMKDWSQNFYKQSSGRWNYSAMGNGEILDNFFALSKVEKR